MKLFLILAFYRKKVNTACARLQTVPLTAKQDTDGNISSTKYIKFNNPPYFIRPIYANKRKIFGKGKYYS